MPLARRRVLVIEDEYFIADDITNGLANLGAEVIGPVAEIEEAEDIVRRGDALDAAVLDINIRNELIFPLARALRERKIPFVFTTGYDKSTLEPEFQDIQLLEKPLDISRLGRTLARLMLKR
jgi:DNA-binding LytR/AlgR family response regulator